MEVKELLTVGLTLAVLGIGLAYAMNVVTDIGTGFTTATAEKNATIDTVAGLAKIPAKMGLIVTVIIAAVIIGLLLRYLMIQ